MCLGSWQLADVEWFGGVVGGTFLIDRGCPVAGCVVDGAVVVYACRKEVGCAFLGGGGLD